MSAALLAPLVTDYAGPLLFFLLTHVILCLATYIVTIMSLQNGLHDMSPKACQHWELGRGWRWDKLAEILPIVTLLKLASTGLELDEESADQVGWMSAGGKKFSQFWLQT